MSYLLDRMHTFKVITFEVKYTVKRIFGAQTCLSVSHLQYVFSFGLFNVSSSPLCSDSLGFCCYILFLFW